MEKSKRIQSIDILRGIVMIIMALDHTRDFFHHSAMTTDPLAPASTTYPLFFTRWITHFCAPVFVMLSGISIYISSQNKASEEASASMFKRGLWLIIAEITLVTFGITFNPFFNVIILQVIWAIGFSMILLSIISRISFKAVLLSGIILLIGHNTLDYVAAPTSGVSSAIWNIFFRAFGSAIPISSNHIILVLYAILPWTAAMFIGYALGYWYNAGYSGSRRRKNLLITGLVMTIAFILLRFINGYGDPSPRLTNGSFPHDLFSFLNTSKYPPSLMYLCMTLGPSLILLSIWEKTNTAWSRFVSVYGKVPFFYYILHFYLIHLFLIILFFSSGYGIKDISSPGLPFYFRPLNFGYDLWIVYVLWIVIVLLLYKPSQWFGRYKARNNYWWLKYI